jgi:hypothetical protein
MGEKGVKRLLNSEAVARLGAALAHGDIGPTRLERRRTNFMARRSRWAREARAAEAWLKLRDQRRRKRAQRKAEPAPKVWQPRIFYFEEADLPMLPQPRILPEIVMGMRGTEADRERILARQAREREIAALLHFYDEELYRSRQQLERIKAQIAEANA